MAAAEVWARARRNVANPGRRVEDIGWATALWVGCWQALALMPGASRSGTTITAGLFAGLARPAAARFSFLLSLPAVFAAGVKELYDEFKKLRHPDGGSPSLFASADDALALLVGLVVSAVVGYLAIAGLLAFLRRYSLTVFVVYRLVFGALILLMLRAGYLQMH
jgi:undecaprenyl-diphosphatase